MAPRGAGNDRSTIRYRCHAAACLIGAAEGRDFMMHARIGMLRALNLHVERVFNPSRKDTQWGKRKLKRDE
jgi:hypothetical protein